MNTIFSLNTMERKILLLLGDTFIVISFLFLFTKRVLRGTFNFEEQGLLIIISYSLLFFFIAYVFDLYNMQRALDTKLVFRLSLVASIIFSISVTLITVFIINTTVSRFNLLAFFLLFPFSLLLWRISCSKFLKLPPFLKNTVYIYEKTFENEVKDNIESVQGSKNSNGYRVKLNFEINNSIFNNNPKRLNTITNKVQTIIIRIKNYHKMPKEVGAFLTNAMSLGKEVFTFTSFYETTYEALPLNLLGDNFYEVLELKNKKAHYFHKLFTRAINITLCLIVGVFFIISIPFVWVFNIFFNKGPLFFIQKRVGKQGIEFNIFKYRSMVQNAEDSGAKMATKNDSRVTTFGRILRKYRIDELPQVISIMKGDMSLIGPRPERKIFVNQLNEISPFYNIRHLIKPGITGWAQVKYKYGENLNDSINKLEYDLYYIKNKSITLDIRILFKTITTILFSRGI